MIDTKTTSFLESKKTVEKYRRTYSSEEYMKGSYLLK